MLLIVIVRVGEGYCARTNGIGSPVSVESCEDTKIMTDSCVVGCCSVDICAELCQITQNWKMTLSKGDKSRGRRAASV